MCGDVNETGPSSASLSKGGNKETETEGRGNRGSPLSFCIPLSCASLSCYFFCINMPPHSHLKCLPTLFLLCRLILSYLIFCESTGRTRDAAGGGLAKMCLAKREAENLVWVATPTTLEHQDNLWVLQRR